MSIGTKTKHDVVTEFRSAEILEAARGVFARKGFSAATVDDIAEAANVAKGTLYLYFPSKREIYLAALKHGIQAINEETQRQMEASRTIQEKLRAFIGTRVRYFDENNDFFRIYHSEFGNILIHPAHIDKEFRDLYLEQAKVLEAILRTAQKQGKIRDYPAHSLALMVYDMTKSLILQRLLGGEKGSVEEDVSFLFDLMWRGMSK